MFCKLAGPRITELLRAYPNSRSPLWSGHRAYCFVPRASALLRRKESLPARAHGSNHVNGNETAHECACAASHPPPWLVVCTLLTRKMCRAMRLLAVIGTVQQGKVELPPQPHAACELTSLPALGPGYRVPRAAGRFPGKQGTEHCQLKLTRCFPALFSEPKRMCRTPTAAVWRSSPTNPPESSARRPLDRRCFFSSLLALALLRSISGGSKIQP